MYMRIICGILVLNTILFAAPPKQSPEQTKLIIGILKDAQFVQNLEAGMRLQMDKTLQDNPALPRTVIQEMKGLINEQNLLQELAHAWGDAYTVAELKSIQAFLKTSAGKKFLAQQSIITERMAGVGAMVGLDIYQMLNKHDPSRYPMDEKTRAAIAKYGALRQSLR